MRKSTWVSLGILAAIVAIFVIGLQVGAGEFAGADGKATDQVAEKNSYKPWFEPIWSPGSSEVESGIFAMQAALGAGLVGFVLGSLRERSRSSRD